MKAPKEAIYSGFEGIAGVPRGFERYRGEPTIQRVPCELGHYERTRQQRSLEGVRSRAVVRSRRGAAFVGHEGGHARLQGLRRRETVLE